MKILTDELKTQIAVKHGNEANVYIVVAWPGQTATEYSEDRILQVGAIDAVTTGQGRSSQSISLVLDDVAGDFKSKIDLFDTHSIPCSVYQRVTGVSDPFLLFSGVIASPLVWSEGDRTVTFNVETKLLDKEVGYTDIYGQFWPLCFGSPRYVPISRITEALTATLDDTLCIPDYSIPYKMSLLVNAYQDQQMIARYYNMVVTGADELAPKVTVLIDLYCDILRTIRNLLVQLEALSKQIRHQQWIMAMVDWGGGLKLDRKIRAGKEIIKLDRQIKEITGNWSDAERAAQRLKAAEDIAAGKRIPTPAELPVGMLPIIGDMKFECERLIMLAMERYRIKKEALTKIVQCHSEMARLNDEYRQYQVIQCEQAECTRSRVHINQKLNHPLTGERFIIGGLVWNGTVDGDYLNLTSQGPLYQNVAVQTWTAPVEDCDSRGWNVFYITDPTKQMVGLYCLVTSRREGDEARHIIKVTEQDGCKCTYELIPFGTNKSSNRLIQMPLVSGTYSQQFGPVPGGISVMVPGPSYAVYPELASYILNRLNGTPLSEEEYWALIALQRIWPQDTADNLMGIAFPGPTDIYTIVGWEVAKIEQVAKVPLESWFDDKTLWIEVPNDLFWQVPIGEKIYQEDKMYEVYVANVLPSTILSVKAYQTVDSKKQLMEVPSVYYTKNEDEDVGPFHVTSLRFNTPLSMIKEHQWDETLYVSLTSSVGPNVVDVLESLISTYTDKTHDETSFEAVKILQEKYPVDFAILQSKNIFDLMAEIAWQARCAIYEINGIYYLKYLSLEADSVKTLTEDDIEVSTLELTCNETENVITRFVAKWKPNYLDTTEQQYLILKFNTALFGENEEQYDFYIYKHEVLVQKSATFWMIRGANIWKEVAFDTFFTHCDLEYLDTIELDLASPFFADSKIKAEIREVNYDSITKTVKLKLWLPVRFGEMTQYPLAWPADIDATTLFPTEIDIEKNYVPVVLEVQEVQGK
jgi:hypothetical protein